MVGATKKFIRKPFILSSITLGVYGALLALIGLGIATYYLNEYFPEFNLLQDVKNLGILFIVVFMAGLLITWFSAFFATQRFLNLRTDQLYY